MVTARAALALIVLMSGSRTLEAETCAPRAELGGDAEAVASVAAELNRLGVATTNVAGAYRATHSRGCPVVVAAVELDRGGGIAVAVRDASQRSEGRVVSDAVLAAAWIDSWLRDEFEAPLELIETPPANAPAQPIDAAVAAPVPVLEQISVAASFTQTWTFDQTRWTGIGVAACIRVGGFCLGGRAGYATQDVTANLTAATRSDISVLATASWSQSLGNISIAPEVGLGLGRLTTERIEGCKMEPLNCDPNDPMCVEMKPPCEDPTSGVVYVGDGFRASTYTPRASAALRAAVPLFEHVWLDALAAITVAPFGHADQYSTDPGAMTMAPMPDDSLSLPGEPKFGLQLGIGLRLGGR